MRTGSFVDGKWFHPTSSARKVRNVNPADTEDVLAEFPSAGAAEVARAIEGAEKAQREWARTPGPERGRVLARAVEIARRRAEEIARTLTREEGKILKESRGEVQKGIAVLEFYAGEGFRLQGRTLPSEIRDVFTCTIRRPLGVVGAITPWNFPWAIPCWKTAPALVAGNAVIFKPAELTPATATLLVEIYEEAGLPTNGASPREAPLSVDMAAGQLAQDQALSELGTGVWVGNLWYLNFSDRSSCRTTGMTRFATFWVDAGEIVAFLDVMRFDETIYRVLGSNLRGLTREREMLLDAQTYEGRSTTSAHLPGALVEDFTFTL